MRLVVVLIAGTIAAGSAWYGSNAWLGSDPVIKVETGNKTMAAARAQAKETLPKFWKAKSETMSGKSAFSLKVAITDDNGIEHFWVGEISRLGDRFEGRIDNEPDTVKSVSFNQRYEFGADQISDWMYKQNGKIYGGYSIRVLAEMAPEEQREGIRSMLAYEPEWDQSAETAVAAVPKWEIRTSAAEEKGNAKP